MNFETFSPQQPGSLTAHQTLLGAAWYRVRQFWLNLSGKPSPLQLEQVQRILNENEYVLFLRLQPGEQAHSLQILEALQANGQTHPGLLAAALLHDIGKIRFPLHLWERILIVFAQAVFPRRAQSWGKTGPKAAGWRKPYIVASQHAAWGAELAKQAGSSPLTAALIRRHADRLTQPLSEEDRLLAWLQAYDNES